MSVVIEGKTYASHAEYFEKYPHKKYANRRHNIKVLMHAYEQPCADCKMLWHPFVMTLDHTERDGYKTSTGKRKHPSEMLGYPPELFVAEVSKCEVVCTNCHHLREWLRDGYITKDPKRWQKYAAYVFEGAHVVAPAGLAS